jgi:hypothetical protein
MKKLINGVLLACGLAMASAKADMVLYTDQSSFVTALNGSPYVVNTFNDLNGRWGSVANLRYSYGATKYGIGSWPEDAVYAMDGAIGALDNNAEGPVLRVFVDSYIRAIGMNVFGTDATAANSPAVDFTVGMYGGEEGEYYVGGVTDGFYGFILDTAQAGTYVDIYNFNWSVDNIYPSLDNLYISTMDGFGGDTSIDTPEPTTIILNLVTLLLAGVVGYRYRHQWATQ